MTTIRKKLREGFRSGKILRMLAVLALLPAFPGLHAATHTIYYATSHYPETAGGTTTVPDLWIWGADDAGNSHDYGTAWATDRLPMKSIGYITVGGEKQMLYRLAFDWDCTPTGFCFTHNGNKTGGNWTWKEGKIIRDPLETETTENDKTDTYLEGSPEEYGFQPFPHFTLYLADKAWWGAENTKVHSWGVWGICSNGITTNR